MKTFAPPIAAAVIVAVAVYAGYRDAYASARRGWNLEPVAVATLDMEAGAILSAEMIARQAIPSQFVTENSVRPELASKVVGRKLLIGVAKGDPLLWSEFK